jgi:hypothetical protein
VTAGRAAGRVVRLVSYVTARGRAGDRSCSSVAVGKRYWYLRSAVRDFTLSFLRQVDARSSTKAGSTTGSSAPFSGQAATCWAVPTRACFNSTNQVEGMPSARQRGWPDRVLGCGWGGGSRLGWGGDLGFGGGAGGCCVGSWSCVVSPAPLDAAAGLSGSSQTLTSLSNTIAASPQTLGASGQFANTYGDVAQQFSGRLSGTAGLDAKLSGLVSDAAGADAAGRNQSGNVVNAAAGDTARTGPYTHTPAGQRAC